MAMEKNQAWSGGISVAALIVTKVGKISLLAINSTSLTKPERSFRIFIVENLI